MIAIIATLSILVCLTAISCIVCLVMVPIRYFLHKSVKPFAIAAAVSAVLFLVIGITEGIIYEPPEGAAEYGTETTETTTIVVSETTTESTTAVTTTKKSVEITTVKSEPTTAKSKAATAKKTDSRKNKNPEQPTTIKQEAATVNHEQPVVKTTAAPASAPAPTPASGQDIIEKYRPNLVVAAHMALEDFISDYKIPYAVVLWKLAKFDNKGAIIAMTDVTNKSVGKTETAIVVLSPVFENGEMTASIPHFVSVGDIVYGNDGYCDDVFSSIAEMFGGLK